MTVNELIEKLERFNGDLPVTVGIYVDGSDNELRFWDIDACEVVDHVLNVEIRNKVEERFL